MDSSLVIEILLGVLTVVVGLISFLSATRANRKQAEASIVTVDAQAYQRAKEIYEGALATLRSEVEQMRMELNELRRSNVELRDSNNNLRVEIARLQTQLHADRFSEEH